MKGKQVSALIFVLIIALAPLLMLFGGGFGGFPRPTLQGLATGRFSAELEQSLRGGFPGRVQLSNLAWNLRYRTGAKEIDGYFIGENGIIKNVPGPSAEDEARIDEVTGSILAFRERTGLPTYFMLIPTACAVKQHELPGFASTVIYNQREFIEGVYQQLRGGLYTLDAYSALLASQDMYLYYRTEDQVTALGGYVLFPVLKSKLAPSSTYSLDDFSAEFVKHDYRGALQQKFPYAEVKPDVLTLYSYRSNDNPSNPKFIRTFQVEAADVEKGYQLTELYYREALEGPEPLDVYFGGASQTVNIRILDAAGRALSKPSLLIIGDETALSYVPFLVPFYGRITLYNAATATGEQIAGIFPGGDAAGGGYDQVLFAFSTDTYLHCENLSVVGLL